MSLLNYSTTVPAHRTAQQIQNVLVKHGAKSILSEYGDDGALTALAFQVETRCGLVTIRLPVAPEPVLQVLEKQWERGQVPRRYVNQEQAVKVAWRIVKDWVEAQMAILETEMVRMEQIFLPYVVTPGGQTVFEVIEQKQFRIGEGGA